MDPASHTRIFTCPRCKAQYWGGPNEELPDCPHCGFDYRTRQGFRFDLLFLMVLIIAMFGFLLLTSSYKGGSPGGPGSKVFQDPAPEKLPGR
jgi:hypothetical protein